MTVDRFGNDKLLIRLGAEDMEMYELDYKKMNFESDYSRKIIIGLMQLACCRAGLDTRGKKITAEAFLLGEQCLIVVSTQLKRRKYKFSHSMSLCWKLENASDFLRAVESLHHQNICCRKSSAYELGGKYYLIFDYPSVPLPALRVLSEFGTKIKKKNAAARIRENGRLLCQNNAVAAIGKYLV